MIKTMFCRYQRSHLPTGIVKVSVLDILTFLQGIRRQFNSAFDPERTWQYVEILWSYSGSHVNGEFNYILLHLPNGYKISTIRIRK
jgi:hypothetical protein